MRLRKRLRAQRMRLRLRRRQPVGIGVGDSVGITMRDLRRVVRRAGKVGLGNAPVYVQADEQGRCVSVSIGEQRQGKRGER